MECGASSAWPVAQPVDSAASVEDVCGRLIQLSFTKILSSKSERGGARLHKNLLILHLLKRARGHQRTASPSELSSLSAFPSEDEEAEAGEATDFPVQELELVGEEVIDDAEAPEEELPIGAEAALPSQGTSASSSDAQALSQGTSGLSAPLQSSCHASGPPLGACGPCGPPLAPSEAPSGEAKDGSGSDSSGYDSGPSDEDDSAPSSPEAQDPDPETVSPRKRKLLGLPSAEASVDKRPCLSSQGLTPFHPAFESPFPLGQAAQPPPSPPVAHLHRLISVFNSVDMLDV